MNDGPGDWRSEVNWRYVRRLTRAHAFMWLYGLFLLLLSGWGALVGATRTVLGVLSLIVFAASLVAVVPIFGRALQEDHEGPVYSFRVFLILFAFLLSSGGYMWLLSSIGLSSIELW